MQPLQSNTPLKDLSGKGAGQSLAHGQWKPEAALISCQQWRSWQGQNMTLSGPVVTRPGGSVRLTFPCWYCWIHMERIGNLLGEEHKASRINRCINTGEVWRRAGFYPVPCPDHPWGREWCWVGCCALVAPSGDETWGDIQTGIRSPEPEGRFPQRPAKGGEGQGQRAPIPPSRLAVVTASGLCLTHRGLQLQRSLNNTHTHTHTHTHKTWLK